MSSDESVGYVFSPRPRAGVIAGFSGRHLLVAGIGGLFAFIFLIAGLIIPAIVIACIVGVLVLVPVGPGKRIVDVVYEWTAFGVRVFTGKARRDTETTVSGIEDVQIGGKIWGVRPVGVSSGEVWMEVVSAPEFALRATEVQDQILSEWGSWLDSLGHDNSPVKEVTWVEIAAPAASGGPESWMEQHLDPRSEELLVNYLELIGTISATATEHRIFIRLLVSPPSLRTGLAHSVAQAAASTRNVLRPFECQPLAAKDLQRLYEGLFVFGAVQASGLRRGVGQELPDPEPIPPFLEEGGIIRFGPLRAMLWWAAEMPRMPIAADGLATLLAAAVPTTRMVWCTMRPVSSWRAERRSESARTQMESEMSAKSRQGFTPKMAEERELATVERRLQELLSGHTMLGHTMLIATIAPTQELLDEARVVIESAAGTCGLLLERLGPISRRALATLVKDIL